MLRTCVLMGFMCLTTTGAATAQTPVSTPGQTSSSAAAPADSPPVKKFGKMDVRHPLHIGSDYYPKESLKHHEQGRCEFAFYINADGSVPAGQLLRSSGFPRLDTACIESVIDVPLLPASINGTPVTGWSDFHLAWVIVGGGLPPQPHMEKSNVPRMADDYEFQVGEKYYPETARAKHQRGYCVVHTTVDSSGAALGARITRSTGSPILDQACLAAVTAARFTPELQNGRPVADSTDIAIYW